MCGNLCTYACREHILRVLEFRTSWLNTLNMDNLRSTSLIKISVDYFGPRVNAEVVLKYLIALLITF